MGEELSDYEKEVILLAFKNIYERLKEVKIYYKVLKKHMTEEEYNRALEEYGEDKADVEAIIEELEET